VAFALGEDRQRGQPARILQPEPGERRRRQDDRRGDGEDPASAVRRPAEQQGDGHEDDDLHELDEQDRQRLRSEKRRPAERRDAEALPAAALATVLHRSLSGLSLDAGPWIVLAVWAVAAPVAAALTFRWE
jgi:hypothetical protein